MNDRHNIRLWLLYFMIIESVYETTWCVFGVHKTTTTTKHIYQLVRKTNEKNETNTKSIYIYI